MAMQRKTVSPDNARVRLENLCARSEHCEWELREKLRGWCVTGSDAENILASLRKLRFYDDRRFASAYVRDKMLYNRWGKRKIAVGLMAKRVNRELINSALDEVDDEVYGSVLLEFMQAKARSIKEGNTYEGRTKLYRAAMSRGYEPSLVSSYIRSKRIWPEQLDGIDCDDV